MTGHSLTPHAKAVQAFARAGAAVAFLVACNAGLAVTADPLDTMDTPLQRLDIRPAQWAENT